MYSQSEINSIVNNFIKLVKDEFSLEAVYLFGSYATGNAREYSDIDLAIISERFEGCRFFDKRKLNKYILKTSVDLEIHPFKPEDFTEDNPLVKEILQAGQRLL